MTQLSLFSERKPAMPQLEVVVIRDRQGNVLMMDSQPERPQQYQVIWNGRDQRQLFVEEHPRQQPAKTFPRYQHRGAYQRFLGVLLIASLLTGCSLRTHHVAFVAAQSADLASTRYAMSRGAVEANSIMGQSLTQQLAVKAAGTVGVLWLSDVLSDRGRDGVSKALLTAVSVALGIVSARNVWVVR